MNEGIGEFLKLAPGVEWLIEKPLRLAVLYEMASRAMKNPERLCYLSKNEYRKFSLKRSQWNQIERVLRDLETGNKRATFVQRTGRVDEETGAIEYRLVDNIFIDTSKTRKNLQQASDGQRTGNKRAQTKEKSRYNKKEIYKEKSFETNFDQPYEETKEPLQSSEKVSPVLEQVIALGLKMGVKFLETTKFAIIEEKYSAQKILDVAENLFTWVADNPKQKASSARLLNFLKRDFSNKKQEGTSQLDIWSKRSSTIVHHPAMQRVSASTINEDSKNDPLKRRLFSLQDRFKSLGELRGITIKFGVPSFQMAQLPEEDERIYDAGIAMLERQIKLDREARLPTRNFNIGFTALTKELNQIVQASPSLAS